MVYGFYMMLTMSISTKVMRNDTHTEIIGLGNGVVAILTGVTDKCQHDDEGPELLFNNDGEYFKRSDVPEGDKAANEFWLINKISGGCVSCSKCGKPYTPDFNALP